MSLALLLLVLLPVVGRAMSLALCLLALHLVARVMARARVLLRARGTQRVEDLIGGLMMIWPLMTMIITTLKHLLKILVVLGKVVDFSRPLL